MGTVEDEVDDEDDAARKHLTFNLGNEIYALPISCVTEIVGRQDITYIPDVPHYVRGVINLRGRVIPVIDVRLRFGQMEREYDSRTCTIVVDVGGVCVGLIVDSVKEVLNIEDHQIEEPPGIAVGAGSGYMSGIGKLDGEVTIILEPSQVLGQDSFDGFM
ncbi:MAG: purine-binding chemotaxis protein CheW [Myxococcales bacterium]|nr:purine-binding chemotaxis protein CheW [Myxococcales bacterium]